MPFFCLLVFTVIVFTTYASDSSTDILFMQTALSESSNWYSVNCTVDTEKHKHLSHLVLHDEQDKNVFVTKSFVDFHCNVSSVLAECIQSRYNSLKTLAIVIHVPDNVTRCFNCTAHFYKTSSWQNDTQTCLTGHSSQTELTSTPETSDVDCNVFVGLMVLFITISIVAGVTISILACRGKCKKTDAKKNNQDEPDTGSLTQGPEESVSDQDHYEDVLPPVHQAPVDDDHGRQGSPLITAERETSSSADHEPIIIFHSREIEECCHAEPLNSSCDHLSVYNKSVYEW